jgi:probable addiction module antidote protein
MNDEQHGGLAPLDVADLLDGPEAIAAYLDAVAELDDPAAFVAAVGHAARAYGMTEIAARAGVGRESLYKSLSPSTHPRFDTIAKVLEAMGVRISIGPIRDAG